MSLFDYLSYKDYLNQKLSPHGPARGQRSKLAEALNCQTGFISQVLKGHSHFSLEHAVKINTFLQHDQEESHFFMLLVHKERAGSVELERYYLEQINAILESRKAVKNRVKAKEGLSVKDHQEYYSHWYYAALHVLVSIPKYKTKSYLRDKLGLEPLTFEKCLKFLIATGLIYENDDQLELGNARIHLDRSSPMISKHHTNWRLEAIKALENDRPQNLHYSSIWTVSQRDFLLIREKILSFLEELEPIFKASNEEELACFNIDFFEK